MECTWIGHTPDQRERTTPFCPAADREEHPYTLQDPDSPLFEVYRGAYGNIADYLVILMGERKDAQETFRLRRLERTEKTNYEIAFDNLCENLWHQMSFYPASWLALPYLARLMEGWEQERDFGWVFRGILAAGSVLATDVYGDRPGEEDIQESYEQAACRIREITIDFLSAHMDDVRERDGQERRELAAAVTAVLGERKLAYLFFLSGMESCYVTCPACENCDEEIEFGYFEPSERIEKAVLSSKSWDGRNLEDAEAWLPALFELLGDEEGRERLRYYFGTYVCPECGERMPVLEGMEAYFLGE